MRDIRRRRGGPIKMNQAKSSWIKSYSLASIPLPLPGARALHAQFVIRRSPPFVCQPFVCSNSPAQPRPESPDVVYQARSHADSSFVIRHSPPRYSDPTGDQGKSKQIKLNQAKIPDSSFPPPHDFSPEFTTLLAANALACSSGTRIY